MQKLPSRYNTGIGRGGVCAPYKPSWSRIWALNQQKNPNPRINRMFRTYNLIAYSLSLSLSVWRRWNLFRFFSPQQSDFWFLCKVVAPNVSTPVASQCICEMSVWCTPAAAHSGSRVREYKCSLFLLPIQCVKTVSSQNENFSDKW